MAKGKETPKELVHDAIAMRAAGMSLSIIATRLGLHRRTVIRTCRSELVEIYRLGFCHGVKSRAHDAELVTSAKKSH